MEKANGGVAEPTPTVAQPTVSPELSKKVRLILSQAGPVTYHSTLNFGAFAPSGTAKEPEFVDSQKLYDRASTQVDLLKKLYAALSPQEQEQFPHALLTPNNERSASVAAHALVELHHVDALRAWSRIDRTSILFWTAIAQKLRYEHWLFSPDDLKHVLSGMGGIYTAAVMKMSSSGSNVMAPEYRDGQDAMHWLDKTMRPVMTRVEYERLKSGLLNVQNPALDNDRRTLLSRLETLGFDKRLSDALNEIDRRYVGAATAFDFKTAMELLRTFFEEFLEEAARKTAERSPVTLPSGPKLNHFSTYKDYLRNADIIAREEEELLQKLYNFLSNMGSHVLGSTPEQFHVSRTTVVEWSMMIAGRVQAFIATP